MTPQERSARACHQQAIAIGEALFKMECPPHNAGHGCQLCKAIRTTEGLRVALSALYPR